MPIARTLAVPNRSPEHDRDLIWLSQVLSPSSYGVTSLPPAHARTRDWLTEAVEAQLAPARAQHDFLLAWAATEGAGHA